jgi:nicotinate-nucleotide pyrophosphorylase (carboxylating)
MNATLRRIVKRALREDMPQGDLSSTSLFHDEKSEARLIAKEAGILSGIEIAKEAFLQVDLDVQFEAFFKDGATLCKGDIIARIQGCTKSLLQGERVALNFLQRMSGIASMTRQFVNETSGTNARIYDTRKTTPGLRILEKQAVRDGGGQNHRMNLSTMVMLKDNHLAASPTIKHAVDTVRAKVGEDILIEVEVESLAMFLEAIQTDCDIVMLDNMSTQAMAECVQKNSTNKCLEASGNMGLERIREVASTGVEMISVGALTHSFRSLDISMRFMKNVG